MKNLPGLQYFSSAAVVTVIMLLIYVSVQQSYRTGLNDPQVQIARDLSKKIHDGKSVESYFNSDSFDISQTLSPFVVLYDAYGKAIRSNASLDSRMPQVPAGLFNTVDQQGEYRVSWQPGKGVRMAMVIVKTNNPTIPYVAAGRSMEEVEDRIQNMSNTVFLAWVVCMAIIAITAIIHSFIKPGKLLHKSI